VWASTCYGCKRVAKLVKLVEISLLPSNEISFTVVEKEWIKITTGIRPLISRLVVRKP
jgi:hypothetical protein